MAGCRLTDEPKLEFDVESSIEVLDNILSAFEEPESLPHVHNELQNSTQGNQSEDDGYMSMNGRRAKISPNSQNSLNECPEISMIQSISLESGEDVSEHFVSAPENYEIELTFNDHPASVNEIMISKVTSPILPQITAFASAETKTNVVNTIDDKINNVNNSIVLPFASKNQDTSNSSLNAIHGAVYHEVKEIASIKTNNTFHRNEVPEDEYLSQTTLPKVKLSTSIPSKYASLPCSGPARSTFGLSGNLCKNTECGRSDDGGDRNRLGMGISAVHDAVLRGGVAKLPEPIVNEHPVTIYPGRASPTKTRIPPRTLPGSMDKHREVYRNIDQSTDDINISDFPVWNQSPIKRAILSQIPLYPIDAIQQQIPPNSGNNNHCIDNNNILQNSLQDFPTTRSMHIVKKDCSNENEVDDFSDDSLEDQSLKPPPPPPTVPPPSSFSPEATSSKRGSIAWEINIIENLTPAESRLPFDRQNNGKNKSRNATDHQCQNRTCDGGKPKTSFSPNKLIVLSCGQSPSDDCQSSLTLSSGRKCKKKIIEKQRSKSMELPDQLDHICSTEDEAASICSDSDELLHSCFPNSIGKGTYVIRKGRGENRRLSIIQATLSSTANTTMRKDEGLSPALLACNRLFLPNSRYSIDFGTYTAANAILSPRSRLFLDLPPSAKMSPSMCTLPSAELDICELSNQNVESNGNNVIDLPIEKLCGSSVSISNNGNYSNSTFNVSIGLDDSNSTSNSMNTHEESHKIVPQAKPLAVQNDVSSTTPRRELAPPIEEDEDQDSETQSREAPLRQIENNISALLRGDISVARANDLSHPRRPLGFRSGVHKSESAKEMLLSQNVFGPLPPSPPSSPELNFDDFPPLPLPPLPPSPSITSLPDGGQNISDDSVRGHPATKISSKARLKSDIPPLVPPHRGQPSTNTLKTRSMEGHMKKYTNGILPNSNIPCTLPVEVTMNCNSSRGRHSSGAYLRRTSQSPMEETRLQTSCSLPETPIFTRGCDIARTPHRRCPEISGGGKRSRTAPRSTTNTSASLGSSVIGVGSVNAIGDSGRQRSINQALAGSEILRMTGGPARGWYPKQRANMRPASTEHLDRLHRSQASSRAWDSEALGSGRKPLTLPPNLTPKFFNKSPREALRRVTSLLIKKGSPKEKESKHDKNTLASVTTVNRPTGSTGAFPISHPSDCNGAWSNQNTHKKKGFLKSFWKKSKNFSLDQ